MTGPPAHAPPYSGQASTSSAPRGSEPMLGGPVLSTIKEPDRHDDSSSPFQFRPLYAGHPEYAGMQHNAARTNGSPPQTLKRQASQNPLPEESPAKKQSKWTPEEDRLTIELKGQGIKWDDIAKRLPGRSPISCRLRYQNYLEKRDVWDDKKKNKLAMLYARFKDQMWQKVATEMGIPWRSAESMHWQLGKAAMSEHGNAPVSQLHPSATGAGLNKITAERQRQEACEQLVQEFLSKKQQLIDVLTTFGNPNDLRDGIELTKKVVDLHDICTRFREEYGG